jgi:type I restriction enzyme S subunit
MEDQGEIELGRGEVISTIDLRASPGEYPVYSSSAVGTGKFGQYGKYMFDESLITWSVDGGGRPFLRKKHKFSVTNVSGFLRIKKPDIWNYEYLHAALVKAHQRIQFDYQMKAHPSVIRELYKLRRVPIYEQQTIAQVLDTLDTQIQKTEALIAKLEKIKEGLLHDLLTRGIDQSGQLRPTPEQAPELYKESALGLIPREWEVRQLGAMSEIVSGVTLGGQQPSSSWPLVAYLRVANVQDGYLDLQQVKFLRVKPADVEKFRLIPGDVLMNEGGDFDKLGRGTVWEGEIEPCIHQNHVFRVRTFPELLDPYFLAYFSGSSRGKAYFVKSSKQSTNLASINSTQLRAFEVPVPPFSEQSAIVDHLQSHKNRLELEGRNIGKLKAQKTGLMDDLLTGRVRVTALFKVAV